MATLFQINPNPVWQNRYDNGSRNFNYIIYTLLGPISCFFSYFLDPSEIGVGPYFCYGDCFPTFEIDNVDVDGYENDLQKNKKIQKQNDFFSNI